MFKFDFNIEKDAQDLEKSSLDWQNEYKDTSIEPIEPPKFTISSPEDFASESVSPARLRHNILRFQSLNIFRRSYLIPRLESPFLAADISHF